MQLLILVVYFCANVVKCDNIRSNDDYGLTNDEIGGGKGEDFSIIKLEKIDSGPDSQNYGKKLQDYKNQENYKDLEMKQSNQHVNYEYGYNDEKDNKGYRRQRVKEKQRDGTYYDENEKEILDKIFGYTGPTANDEPENIIRPCALDDWQCIRKYFAANSKCKPTFGPIPDPLKLDLNTVTFPIVNMTVTFPNYNLRGLSSAKMNTFYVNKKSGNLVFAIDVQNLSQVTPRTYVRYQRTAKESIVLADIASFSFRSVTFTAVIPKIPYLRLDLADIHVDAQDGTPAFAFGPGAFNSTDPDVITAFSQFPVLLPFAAREGFFFQVPLFTAVYIQKNICDFGLKLISV